MKPVAYLVQAKHIITPDVSDIMVDKKPVPLLSLYERVETILPAANASGYDPVVLTETLRRRLTKFTADDALILSGSPYAIMVAGYFATHYAGGTCTALEWDRRASGSAGAYRLRQFNFTKGTNVDGNEEDTF